jgi:hypothetical protein
VAAVVVQRKTPGRGSTRRGQAAEGRLSRVQILSMRRQKSSRTRVYRAIGYAGVEKLSSDNLG